ncbi:MAG: 23S rRNA (guanosine(2251)-2'-O)-methyltransferase RlmB [Ignavibacteriales bacterium]|nr:23S rRNA (guanosine(2251)-2'-O)-methyltransferase RlmB [Ignavibacteriales bacterium]
MPEFIAGRNPVTEALRSGTLIEKVYFLKGSHGAPIDSIRDLARKRNIPCVEVTHESISKFGIKVPTQGVVAAIGTKEYCEIPDLLQIASDAGQKPFVVIFDEIEDPHNLGALIRTAVCAGAHGGVIPKHHAVAVTETVARTSAGASVHFPMAKVTNIVASIEELKDAGVWIVGTEAQAPKVFMELDFSIPVAIVVGNEGKGIRRLVKEHCDFLANIPMAGSFDSLNASVAGALVMYEVLRQRTKR